MQAGSAHHPWPPPRGPAGPSRWTPAERSGWTAKRPSSSAVAPAAMAGSTRNCHSGNSRHRPVTAGAMPRAKDRQRLHDALLGGDGHRFRTQQQRPRDERCGQQHRDGDRGPSEGQQWVGIDAHAKPASPRTRRDGARQQDQGPPSASVRIRPAGGPATSRAAPSRAPQAPGQRGSSGTARPRAAAGTAARWRQEPAHPGMVSRMPWVPRSAATRRDR